MLLVQLSVIAAGGELMVSPLLIVDEKRAWTGGDVLDPSEGTYVKEPRTTTSTGEAHPSFDAHIDRSASSHSQPRNVSLVNFVL